MAKTVVIACLVVGQVVFFENHREHWWLALGAHVYIEALKALTKPLLLPVREILLKGREVLNHWIKRSFFDDER